MNDNHPQHGHARKARKTLAELAAKRAAMGLTDALVDRALTRGYRKRLKKAAAKPERKDYKTNKDFELAMKAWRHHFSFTYQHPFLSGAMVLMLAWAVGKIFGGW